MKKMKKKGKGFNDKFRGSSMPIGKLFLKKVGKCLFIMKEIIANQSYFSILEFDLIEQDLGIYGNGIEFILDKGCKDYIMKKYSIPKSTFESYLKWLKDEGFYKESFKENKKGKVVKSDIIIVGEYHVVKTPKSPDEKKDKGKFGGKKFIKPLYYYEMITGMNI